MDIQGRLPVVLCTLHNFIRVHDPGDEIEMQELEIMDYLDKGAPHTDPLAEPAREDSSQNQAIAV